MSVAMRLDKRSRGGGFADARRRMQRFAPLWALGGTLAWALAGCGGNSNTTVEVNLGNNQRARVLLPTGPAEPDYYSPAQIRALVVYVQKDPKRLKTLTMAQRRALGSVLLDDDGRRKD